MKKPLFYFLLALSLITCDSPSNNTPTRTNSPSIVSAINYSLINDSLVTYKDSLEDALGVAAQNFEFKKQDLATSSYYHKNWGGQYYISDEAILAAVDSSGELTVILNVWAYSHRNTNLSTLSIQIDTFTHQANSDTSFSYVKPLMVICNCGFHQGFFRNKATQTIAKSIALHSNQSISWAGIKKLSKRDIVGIKESWHLSNLLKKLHSTKQQIAAIQDKL